MLIRLESGINRLMDFIGNVAALLLIVLVGTLSYNVIARYVFQNSSIGLEELSWHIYAAVFLLGIPFALRSASHVRVDLVYERLQPKTQALIDLLGSVLFLLPFSLVVIWSGWQFTMASFDLGNQPASLSQFFEMLTSGGIGEKSQDPGGLLNRWIIKGVIPLSFVFLLIASCAFFIQRLNVFLSFTNLDCADDLQNPTL